MQYFFRSQHIGTRTVTSGEEQHCHVIYLCPTCGQPWAQIIHSGASHNRPVVYDFITRYCDKHHPHWPQAVSGCFLDLFRYPECYTGVPSGVLKHDFLAHMRNKYEETIPRADAAVSAASPVHVGSD